MFEMMSWRRFVASVVVLFSVLPLYGADGVPTAGVTNRVDGTVSTNVAEVAEAVDPKASAYDDIAVLTEALLMVHKHYVEEKTYQEIVYGGLHGMMQSLDPHSSFLEPKAFDDMREDTAGKFGGIGIRIGVRDRLLTVIAPIEDTPAYRAGVLSGDRIIKIQGKRAVGLGLQPAIKLLRGEKGSEVTLTIQRSGVEEPFDVTLVRDDIKVPSVKGVRMLDEQTGYIRITQFNAPTAGLYEAALLELQEKGMTALVLDLRNNPGGLLSSAVEVSQRLLPDEALIVTTRGRGGEPTDVPLEAGGEMHLLDVDVAVLINRGSASASEIVAGALQDHHRAVIVGEKSFGKASVQSVVRMRSNPECAVRMTTAHYYTPSERMIHGVGIEPDIAVSMSMSEWRNALLKRAYEENPEMYPEAEREDMTGVEDRQLARAMDVLTALRVLAARGGGTR